MSKLITDDPANEIPYGYCKCGCGQKAPIATSSRKCDGRIKGEPLPYIRRHKGRTPPDLPNPTGLCLCGCGEPTPLATKTNVKLGRVKGEPVRYIHGHRARLNRKPDSAGIVKLCECGCGQPAPISRSSAAKRGYVKGEPRRFIAGHGIRVRKYPPMEERFWSKVNRIDDGNSCWEWTGGTTDWGYGILGTNRYGNIRAHRFAWELENGPIPDGLWVLHKCDNPRCVRVSHLFLGSHQDNMSDMVEKGRANSGIRPKGSDHGNSKLNEDQVTEIRSRTATGESKIAIAAEFGVSVSLIYAIHNRHIWTHLP